MDLVSAIITTRNRQALLKVSIESVLNQTYPNIELIVVDDGSTDTTKEICLSYPLNYIYIHPSESRGGNYARNLGLKNANGKYVAFLDDDDEWLPTKVEKQMILIKEKGCSLVYCLRNYLDVSKGQIMKIRKEYRPKPSGDLSKIIFRHYITNTSCLLGEKAMIEEVGGFDELFRKWQEYELMIRIAQKSAIYYVDEYLCNYRNDITDSHRISNDFERVKETVVMLKKKYAHVIATLPLKTRLYFYDMCIGDTYKLAKSSNRNIVRWRLFLPHLFFTVFKSMDDFSVARKNVEILKAKVRDMIHR